jgi:hypothetical protein
MVREVPKIESHDCLGAAPNRRRNDMSIVLIG